jgi:hypothetical protein
VRQDELERLRDEMHRSRAETYSLRLDLGEAEALIEALESELSRVTMGWRGPDEGRSAASAMNLLIQARTLLRRALAPRLESDDRRWAIAMSQDPAVAETAERLVRAIDLHLQKLTAVES